MAITKIYKICDECNGTGVVVPEGGGEPVPCRLCNGEKYREYGKQAEESGIFKSYEILNEINNSEYNSLSDEDKVNLFRILSCGLVDLNEGSKGRAGLWSIFDSESTTRANLLALLD